MVFRRSFTHTAAEVDEQLTLLRSAADEIRTSKRLRQVLHVGSLCRPLSLVQGWLIPTKAVLELGNQLNKGTFRGNAAAVKLNALEKVSPPPPLP